MVSSGVPVSTPGDTVKAVDNQKSWRELARIQWRAWVLSFPAGVLFLRTLVRLKEQDVGAHRFWFRADTGEGGKNS